MGSNLKGTLSPMLRKIMSRPKPLIMSSEIGSPQTKRHRSCKSLKYSFGMGMAWSGYGQTVLQAHLQMRAILAHDPKQLIACAAQPHRALMKF